ncbi:MAG: serine--tRNA ligase, partial [Myxococcales bacterium]|nr:serine--tRNA ligase [Myxococcales bacterium]
SEALRAERNDASKAMASLDKKGPEFAERRDALKRLGNEIKALEDSLGQVLGELEELVMALPNLPDPSVPDGAGEDDNVVLRTWGDKPAFDFEPRDHVDLGTALGILDFERGAKITGSRFTVLRGAGARLERALMSFMLDMHTTEHGYEEMWPPALVNANSLRGTGQLPKCEDDLFHVGRQYDEADDSEHVRLYLSPTAEVQITNYHADEILEPGSLPRRYTAYT